MFIKIVIISIWGLLMFRSVIAEYKYYQSVKTLEPEIWKQLGSPKYLKIPIVFVSSKASKLLSGISNKTVCELGNKHRQARNVFLSYVVLVLATAVVYFKIS